MATKLEKPKFVIGLGASAGGLDALEQFFDHAPVDSGAAFVVVMHLSRDFKSMLDELIARRTGMTVKAATDGTELEADTVYVIQPRTVIEVEKTRLKIEIRPDVDPEGVATSVDTMFRSIAKSWGAHGAAIVLSGSGSDGAKGLRAVFDAGGFTAAQSPETAKFDPMPNASIATEAVNAVESPDHLGQTVIDGLTMPMASRRSLIESDDEKAMARIVDAVIGSTSIKAREYKHSTFERRVARRMMDLRIHDLEEYADRIAEDPSEGEKLSQDLLIGVTDFFRDSAPYGVMKHQIIPQIIKNAHEEDRQIRIWIAGCATGEEVYSMAILLREALLDMPFEIDVQLFASDISRKHLAEATAGTYSTDRVSSIPRTLLEKYFTYSEVTETWTVIKRLRKMVVFAPHDLLSDPPFTKLDLVCCRNVLIYFSIEAQQRILGGFGFGLRQGGFLFLGSSETVGGQRDAFEFIDARNRIFRRTQSVGSRGSLSKTRELFPLGPPVTKFQRRAPRVKGTELQPAYAALLEQYAPSCLLVSEDRDLLHSFGDASKYLRAPVGLASLDISDLIDPALKTPLIAALERTGKSNEPLTFTRITLEQVPQEGLRVDLTVKPLPTIEGEPAKQFLVLIDDHKYILGDEQVAVATIDADQLMVSHNTRLEEELGRTREALQSTIEEIETANEELQASNEELMSANEELQSTNEELSSVNEELYSVNAEYHRQNDDLSRLTNDFDLLLNATQIGVLFLDSQGRITRFTGLTKDLYKLEEADVGRSLANFSSPFVDFEPSTMVERHKGEDSVIEQETTDKDGNPWLIRLVTDEENFGLVLAFIDIGDLRDAEAELRRTHLFLESIRQATNAYICETDAQMKVVYSQVGFAEFIGVQDMQLPFSMDYKNVHPEDLGGLQAELAKAQDLTNASHIYRMLHAPSKEYRYVRAVTTRLDNGNWQVVAHDVDDIYRAEVALREKQEILRTTLEDGRSFKAFIRADRTFGFVNDKYCETIGKPADQIIDQKIEDVMEPAAYEETKEYIDAALAGKNRDVVKEIKVGSERILASLRYRPVVNDGAVFGIVFGGINISEIADYAEKFTATDRLLTATARNSNQAVMIVNVENGRIRFANPAAQTRLGLSNAEFAEDKFKISRLTPECGDKRWAEFLQDACDKKHLLVDDILVFDRIEGAKHVDVYLEADVSVDEQPMVVARVIENDDRARVLEDLRTRARRLSSSNRDLEQFTTAVAHDLRAPLRHITSFSDMLEQGVDELSPEEVRDHVGIIGSSARNLSNMVSGLLDYARMGLREQEFETVKLGEVISQAKRNLSAELAETDSTVIVEGAAQVQGNLHLLVSLFQNLFSNSIKYRKPDSKPEIRVKIAEEDGGIRVSVADNGIGIDPDFSSKIFELFQRLHSDEEISGLGIGLTTCRKIAEIHKAEISLDAKHKDGSRFIIKYFHHES